MARQKFSLEPKLFRQWVGFNALGFGIATTICLSAKISDFNIEMLWLSGLIVGSITGICQAITLKNKLPKLRYWQWILANILGGYAGIWGALFVMFNYLEFLNPASAEIICLIFGSFVGLGISLAQSFVLFFHAQDLRLWGFVNIAGRAIAWSLSSFIITGLFTESLSSSDTILPVHLSLITGVIGGTIFGLVTSIALGYLQPKTKTLPIESI
ncbi:hypothetical protein Lepto7376_3051 [[Leptolyngbya] sp. PCC 7376]|uniref:hypothetical protein n=1 Tax=[Leptolyngbya] sp. PCC 7376 TaxID=111781 RepID=UPI00029F02AE|nr:hypothetical protein [[Leptolyngbya] sp. PCC 7376]AFY39291.1 hypothetical protein Lepto7376_3051 [[Leptolyngbya] sp. PCC 7376]